MWYAYAAGFTFSTLIAHFFISRVAGRMRECIGWRGPGDHEFRPDDWQPRIIGVVERTLYTSSILMGAAEFIGLWLAVKVAGQWKRWGEKAQIGDRIVEGRSIYQIFLIGSGLSILYAATGAQLIAWVSKSQWREAVLVPGVVIVATSALWAWLGQYLPNPQSVGDN